MQKVTLTLALAAMLVAGSARAAIITFDDLPGSNADTVTTYVEGTFTVDPTAGVLFKAEFNGSPAPSIFANGPGYPNSDPAEITVTQNTTGLFTFQSIDINTFSGSLAVSIQGFLSGGLVLNQPLNLNPAGFQTILSNDPAQVLDELVILGTPGTSESYNFDNIVVSVVPEPTSFALLTIGSLLVLRRRR